MNRKQLMALSKPKLVNLVINSGAVNGCYTCLHGAKPTGADPCAACFSASDYPGYVLDLEFLEKRNG